MSFLMMSFCLTHILFYYPTTSLRFFCLLGESREQSDLLLCSCSPVSQAPDRWCTLWKGLQGCLPFVKLQLQDSFWALLYFPSPSVALPGKGISQSPISCGWACVQNTALPFLLSVLPIVPLSFLSLHFSSPNHTVIKKADKPPCTLRGQQLNSELTFSMAWICSVSIKESLCASCVKNNPSCRLSDLNIK